MKKSIQKAYFLIYPPSALSVLQIQQTGQSIEELEIAYNSAITTFKNNADLEEIDEDEIPIFLDPEIEPHIRKGDLISLDCDLEGKFCTIGYNFLPDNINDHQIGSRDHQVLLWNKGFGGDELH